jgi:hypothetical protein
MRIQYRFRVQDSARGPAQVRGLMRVRGPVGAWPATSSRFHQAARRARSIRC